MPYEVGLIGGILVIVVGLVTVFFPPKYDRPEQDATPIIQSIEVSPTATLENIDFIASATEALNLRTGPGTFAPVIRVLKNGEVMNILPHSDQGNWIPVQTKDSEEGWINSNFCERSK